jgi:DNA-binding phage protein
MYTLNAEAIRDAFGDCVKMEADTGITRRAIYWLLDGKVNPSYATLCKFMDAYNLTPERFVELFFCKAA